MLRLSTQNFWLNWKLIWAQSRSCRCLCMIVSVVLGDNMGSSWLSVAVHKQKIQDKLFGVRYLEKHQSGRNSKEIRFLLSESSVVSETTKYHVHCASRHPTPRNILGLRWIRHIFESSITTTLWRRPRSISINTSAAAPHHRNRQPPK